MAVKPISVSQLNGYIKRILKTDPLLGDVSVVGEISNLKFHSSGHVFFNLKDKNSRINCFLPASTLPKIRYELSDGMEIVILGYMDVYQPGGYYSLNVMDISVSGMGSLAVAFEKLKAKLEREGIFDSKIKKTIPFFPSAVAVITAETGAAVQDILKIITGKNDYVNIFLFPVAVQGAKAAGEIAEAIEAINRGFSHVDTIILGRGGGSMEDLWAFNEEVVARAIYESHIPVISAVGHETDFTIADFVADARAETPSAAAHMAVPDMNRVKESVKEMYQEINNRISRKLESGEEYLRGKDPGRFTGMIKNRIDHEETRVGRWEEKGEARVDAIVETLHGKATLFHVQIEGSSPLRIMDKGYSAVTDRKGRFIRGVSQLKTGDVLDMQMWDGTANVVVQRVTKKDPS